MKNILSYVSPVTGQDILDWFKYQETHETSHQKEYRFMKKHWYNVRPNRFYLISFKYPHSDKYFYSSHTKPCIMQALGNKLIFK